MTEKSETTFESLEISASTEKSGRGRWVTGAVLILLGVLSLAGQFWELPSLGTLFLPALGLIFLLWGMFTRSGGLLIPGGILAGIGVGVYLMDSLPLEGDAEPGVFLLTFGAGFALITLLSLLFTEDKHWWALIPGGILAIIGGVLFIGGAAVEMLKFWPVILIVIGVYVILKRK